MIEFPKNIDLEKYVLGCLMLDKQDEALKLDELDFYDPQNQLIYKVIKYLAEKNKLIDMISVSDLASKRIEDSLTAVTDICNAVHTTTNFEDYKANLKLYTTKRDLIKKAMEIQERVLNSEHETAIELKNDIMESFDTIHVQESVKNKTDLKSIMGEVMDDIETRVNAKEEQKLYTGYSDIDRLTGGLNNQEFTIIAARPGIGKTAFALQLMLHLASKKNHCSFISREMSNVQLGKRLLSNAATLHNQKLKLCKNLEEQDWTAMQKGLSILTNLPVEINDRIGTIQEIRSYCRQLKNKDKLDVLIIDYIGLLKTLKKCATRREEIDDISRQLKEISLEFKIPVVCLCQLNRDGVKQNKEPEIHELKESGNIEADADNVWLLYMKEEEQQKQPHEMKRLKVIIGKQRNGPVGSIYLNYASTTFKYFNAH